MAEAAKNVTPLPTLTALKLVNGIKCPWRAAGVQVQEIKCTEGERLVEGDHFVWWLGPGGKRVGIPYTNIKQAE